MPSTPVSLLKFAARLASVSTGRSSSIPTSDQVPQEMYAKSSPRAGTPATADAVSCEPTATTGRPGGRPAPAATSGSSSPTTSPGRRSAGKIPRAMPARSISGRDHVRSRTSSSCVVDALVISAPAEPVSQ